MTLLLLFVACSPEEQAYHPELTNPPSLTKSVFQTPDAVALPYRSWQPTKKPQAVIVAIHGFNDYSNGFAYSGAFFQAHDVLMYAYDQRGFGQGPSPGMWAGDANLTRDLKQFVLQVKQTYPQAPVYIMGESMGGAVAIVALAEPDFPEVQGLILVAPALWGAETLNPFYRSALWMLAHTLPTHEFTGSDLKIIATDNFPLLRHMSADPLIIKKTRADAIYGLVHLMDHAYEEVPRIKTPTLLVYGGKDQVIPKEPVEKSVERFTAPLTYAEYPQGYHMLLRDLQRQLVMRDIWSWMQQPEAELPSGLKQNSPSTHENDVRN